SNLAQLKKTSSAVATHARKQHPKSSASEASCHRSKEIVGAWTETLLGRSRIEFYSTMTVDAQMSVIWSEINTPRFSLQPLFADVNREPRSLSQPNRETSDE